MITLYGGTDYTLANAAISDVAWSSQWAPFGFPMDLDKWTVEVVNSTDVTQSSPVSGTWYNVEDISLPIGVWKVEYFAQIGTETSGTQYSQTVYSTLSTGSASESNTHLSANFQFATFNQLYAYCVSLNKSDVVSVASKTTYYLNIKTPSTVDKIGAYGVSSPTIIRAVSAYL